MKKLLLALLVCSGNLSYGQYPFTITSGVNPGGAFPPGPIPYVFKAPTTITRTLNPVTTAQWHFAGQQTVANPYSGKPSSDWIYDLVTTREKETVACGFGNNSLGFFSGTIFKLDHFGNLQWSKYTEADSVPDPNANIHMINLGVATPIPSLETLSYSWSGHTASTSSGSLWAIAKANDGYVAVGRGLSGILIVEVDSAGNFLNGTPIDVIPPNYSSDGSVTLDYPIADGYSVAVDPNTKSVNNIIVGGAVSDIGGSGFRGAFIMELNCYSSASWIPGNVFYGGNGGYTGDGSTGSTITKILTKSLTSTTYDIYACGAVSANPTGVGTAGDNYNLSNANADDTVINFDTYNKDIWLLKMDNTMASVTSQQYNKSNIFVAGGTSTTYDLNNIANYHYQETGPLSARNMSSSYYDALQWWNPVTSSYVYSPATEFINFTNNYNEAAYDMTFTSDGYLAVISLVNLIGTNPPGVGQYTASDVVQNTSYGGAAPDYAEYDDGDAFLLKINESDLSFVGAKNVGHFSGIDFFMKVKQNREGNYIVSGSTSDLYSTFGEGSDYNLSPDPDVVLGLDRAFIVSTDNTFNVTTDITDLWRRSFLAADPNATIVPPGATDNNIDQMMCVFAMDTTADGGYEIGGNNGNNNDDYVVTKFAPPYQEQMVDGSTGGGYYMFGGSAVPIVHTVSGTETWSSSMSVGSLVEVPSGATLNITGSGTKISFAASDQLWDYYNDPTYGNGPAIGCGIIVEPGGTLNVTQATLQGITPPSTSAPEHNVWDGIVVEANYTSGVWPATLQGQVTLTGATINDARCGVYVAQNYRTYNQYTPVSYPPPSISTPITSYGSTYSSDYNGYYSLGGGLLTVNQYASSPATPTTFNDCYYGAVFQTYGFHGGSTISGATFTCDANGMGDICYYTNPAGSLIPPNTHIGLWNCGNTGIYNNIFTCNSAFTPQSANTTGIQAVGTYAIINNNGSGPGNTFTNLGCGVMGSANGSLDVSWNTFDNNANGIKASGGGTAIQNNTIQVPSILPGYNATGITLAGANGYNVTNNTFTNCSTCGSGYGDLGIVVNDGHTENEYISSNNFSRVRSPNIALQTNGNGSSSGTTGLQYHCNTFYSGGSDISRYSTIAGYTTTTAGTINKMIIP